MRILYGVQGTGNGHLTRARIMAKAFKAKSVDVDFFFSGRANVPFFDMQDFGHYQIKAGLTFSTQNGCVSVAHTLKDNSLLAIRKDVKALDLSQYDVVINDFEPISAWAARLQGVTAIGISHQVAMQYDVPKSGYSWFSRWFLNYFAPVDIALGCHWHHFGFPILPPFVDVVRSQVGLSHQILVYLPFEVPKEILALLLPFTEYQFIVYHSSDANKPFPDHIKWHPLSRGAFKRDLACSAGVITNAGFELPSEALTLGKKLLVKPLHGQFEQLSNMTALALLGAADSMMQLDKNVLRRWLKSLPLEAINYPEVADNLVDWILSGNWNDTQSLCQSLWKEVRLPESWRKKSP